MVTSYINMFFFSWMLDNPHRRTTKVLGSTLLMRISARGMRRYCSVNDALLLFQSLPWPFFGVKLDPTQYCVHVLLQETCVRYVTLLGSRLLDITRLRFYRSREGFSSLGPAIRCSVFLWDQKSSETCLQSTTSNASGKSFCGSGLA